MSLTLHRLIWKQRGHEVIKASSPPFCHVIVAGSIVGYLGTALTIMGDDVTCRSVPTCLAVAFAFIFGSLFTKTWRIHKVETQCAYTTCTRSVRLLQIFNSERLRPTAYTNRDLFAIVGTAFRQFASVTRRARARTV